MYKIRGGDGKEYGPVSADTLRAWVTQGRANAQTFVLAEGATEWKTLATCAEFADLFATRATGDPGTAVQATPDKTSSMAIWSLVLGISAFLCGVTAIPGLILGIIAQKQIKDSMGRLGGRGLALGGTITSAIALLLLPVAFLAAMLLPALAKAKGKAQTINCVNNLKQLGLSVRLYSGDHADKYPSATNWCDAILAEAGTPKIYVCPGAPDARCGYAFNAKLSGLDESKLDPNTVMIFESDAGWNASGGRELMITKPRHGNHYVVGLADGSVQQMTEAQIKQLRWDPKPETNTTTP